jgi:hypothetical protein
VAAAAVLIVLAAGCRGASPPPAGHDQLATIAKYYGLYQGQHHGETPASEQKLKEFIRARDRSVNVESLFVSPRDQQPFVIRYGKKVAAPGPGGASIVAYEKAGVSGRRLVARCTVQVEEIAEVKLKELLPNP